MKRALLIASVTLAVLAAAAGLAYAIGVARISDTASELAAQAPEAAPSLTEAQATAPVGDAPATPSDSPAAGPAAAYGAASTTQEVPPPDPNSPFAKDIPGCICHSDDPEQVKSHASYRMNQCAGCHQGGVPTGQ